MQIAARLGLPVAVHAENDGMTGALSADGARGAGARPSRDYLDSRPIAAEAEAISRALLFAEETGCALHVVHTSSARGVQLIRAAVEAGLCDATCETCPHYLLLDEDVEAVGARAKCAPPLRSDAERDKLLAEVAAGRVDTIGSDHSPSPPEMKKSADFFQSGAGSAACRPRCAPCSRSIFPFPCARACCPTTWPAGSGCRARAASGSGRTRTWPSSTFPSRRPSGPRSCRIGTGPARMSGGRSAAR